MSNRRFNNSHRVQAQAGPANQQVQIDLRNAKQQKCVCGNMAFIEGFKIFVISALISPTGQELVAKVPAPFCTKCFAELEGPNTDDTEYVNPLNS